MSVKRFLDDLRSFEQPTKYHYNCVRSYKSCVLLLSLYNQIDVINLDYEMGTKETGLDVLKYIYENDKKVNTIIIHSTHREGVNEMEKYIKKHLQHVNYKYCPCVER